jgi:hypothetical protein
MLGRNTIAWKSKVSSPIPQSVFEAEWLALNMLARELTWTRDIMGRIIGHPFPASVVKVDNKACLERLDDRVSEGNKHFKPKYFLVLSLVKEGVLSVVKVRTEDNASDLLTKALGNPLFANHVRSVGIE